jgi:methylenetetrahydrofolate dehydrogenase (NAD+)
MIARTSYSVSLLRRRGTAGTLHSKVAQHCHRSSLAAASDAPEGIIDVSDLADRMRASVRVYTSSQTVRMVGILAQQNASHPFLSTDAEIYSARIEETFAEDGIDYEVCRCTGEEPSDVEEAIRQVNDRDDVHGVLVFYPIFKNRKGFERVRGPYLDQSTGVHYKTHDDYLRDVVSPAKDVEGLCQDYNSRWLFRARGMNRTDQDVYVPCTALSVMKILEEYHPYQQQGEGKRWSGCTITVVNRSEILGRPLAGLLALEGATVYSVDEASILLFKQGGRMSRCTGLTLEDCLQRSSIVVTGVPSPSFLLPSQAILPGTTVVNVAECSNVCEQTLLERPNVHLIPQVGKVTVAALEQNLVRLHQRILSVQNS